MSDDPSKPGILAQSQQFTVLEPTQPFGPPQHEVEEPNTDAETESGSETATEVTDAPSYTPRSNHSMSLP